MPHMRGTNFSAASTSSLAWHESSAIHLGSYCSNTGPLHLSRKVSPVLEGGQACRKSVESWRQDQDQSVCAAAPKTNETRYQCCLEGFNRQASD